MLVIKNILIGTTLLGVGGAVGYYISRKILEKQYHGDVAEIKELYRQKVVELEEMIEKVKGSEEYDILRNRRYDDPEEPEEEEDLEETEEEREAREEALDALAVYRGERRRSLIEYNKPDLNRFVSEGVSVVIADGVETLGDIDQDGDGVYDDEDDLDQEAEDYAVRHSEDIKNDRPYLIEPEDYHDGPEGYDHQALYYYAHDRTLCEDDDREVEEEEECVGFDYEDKLDTQTTCWVRNDQLRVLYEIHRIDESYKKAVLNVAETPREREFRLQGRRKQALDDNFVSK